MSKAYVVLHWVLVWKVKGNNGLTIFIGLTRMHLKLSPAIKECTQNCCTIV